MREAVMVESPGECGLYVDGECVWRDCNEYADRWGSGPVSFGTVALALAGEPAVLTSHWCDERLGERDLPDSLDACLAAFTVEIMGPGRRQLHRISGT